MADCFRPFASTPVLLLSLLLGACSDRPPDSGTASSTPPTSNTGPEADTAPGLYVESYSEQDNWTLRSATREYGTSEVVILTDARIEPNAGFDRFILEFDGDEMPSYTVEYPSVPITECGSGAPVQLGTPKTLVIRLEPAQAHDQNGHPTLRARSFSPQLPVLREVRLTCDFEAHVGWALGVSADNRFRIMPLSQPTRLIVDVSHSRD